MNIAETVNKCRGYFSSGKTLDIKNRKSRLVALRKAICDNERDIIDALKADLNKSETESTMTEISMVLSELDYMLAHMEKWAKPKKVATPLFQFRAKSAIYPCPYGTVLVVSPWNYPFQLTFSPLIGAIAAGNSVVVKPSAYSAKTTEIIKKIIANVFLPEYVAVVTGGRTEFTTLLAQKFDYIFFTGSTAVGKVVMRAAAENLTPISLELGGKSPAIVDETANLQVAARRIVFGKTLNAGQTCIAPDYVVVQQGVKTAFLNAVKNALDEFFGKEPDFSDFPKIITDKHFLRLTDLIRGEKVLYGGKNDPSKRFIEPTVIDDCTFSSRCMSEEIFGPLLPVLVYSDIDGLIAKMKTMPKPLALYLFTESADCKQKIISQLPFGGGCVNDAVMHIASETLPFGGVGESGMGSYHGKKSFATFTHYKSVLDKKVFPDIKARYRPYTDKKSKLIKKLFK